MDHHIHGVVAAHFLQINVFQAARESVADVVDQTPAVHYLALHEHHSVTYADGPEHVLHLWSRIT